VRTRSKQKRRVVRPIRRSLNHKAAATIVRPERKPWELKQEEIEIIRNSICKGATDAELKYCLAVSNRYKLDPFRKQIWFVPRWDADLRQNVWVPQVSIWGLLHIAARDHGDFGSKSLPEYGPNIAITRSDRQGKEHKLTGPEWAKVKVWKKGVAEPTEAIAYFEEYCPRQWENCKLFWTAMPKRMIGKCATALAIQEAYPELGGLHTPETAGRIQGEFTPSGREIVAPIDVESQQSLEASVEALDANNEALKRFEERAGAEAKPAVEHMLFYVYAPESETYFIDGAQSLKTANRDLLEPLWNGARKAIIATPAQLGKLISQFEDRKVPFREHKNA
jgi:phage recombination protein Bet